MRRASRRTFAAALAAALALAAFPSCSRLKSLLPREEAPPPAAAPADRVYAEGAAALLKGNPERALERFAEAWKENPGHAGVLQDFDEALNALKKAGDEAYRAGRYEQAGRSWTSALRYLGHPAARAHPLPFTKADLQAKIDRMTTALMEKAIVDYRQGNIEGAIALWKTILSYDPSHKEASQSLKTATTQLENLRKIPPPAK